MWSYNDSDFTSSLNQARRLIGDVNSTSPEFSDEEMNFYIDTEASIFGAASLACQSLAAKYATQTYKSVGDLRINLEQKYEHYKELSEKYQSLSKAKGSPQLYAGGISKADKVVQEEDTDRVPPAFTVDMHDYNGTTVSTTN